ncbi:methyltransferase domain-containing protein [Lichenibacterium minor]|uniref:Methyltransferase domain-containing protein n=1 Tax=Lichenibacterium minor TaxID=2316528 RepID=A0A4V1RUT6_9HYPH|nr:methyltransferase domain-containing protein [Lichenibacterium minor]RYC32284.1 methyltransferase domain-containing protein [Lichenibacterium minor]
MSSSSDLIADRRFAWARGYAEDGDHAAAADLLAQVVERAPAWAPGWAALGEARERSGDPAGARRAWAEAAALDPAGTLGADAHVARLDGRTPQNLPASYVRALFDDYAPRFDRHLVDALDYRGPAVLADALERAAPGRRFAAALDLGCGTGLMGLALRGRADRVDGVDLSPAMAERARATGAYAAVAAGPLDEALAAAAAGSLDLAVAVDVLVYVGDLAPVFAGAARALAPGGLLAVTVQTLREGDGFALGPDMRFSHAPGFVEAALRGAGLAPVLLEPASTRREKGVAVPGLVAVASKA